MPFFESLNFLLALFNPFLLIVYLIEVVKQQSLARFRNTLTVAGLISFLAFAPFALLGEVIFTRVFGVNFASFQIFGGVVFLLIGLQFVFKGPGSIEMLRGDSDKLASTIAMPLLIGPGTISAAVLTGQKHHPLIALLIIALAITISLGIMIGLKALHDRVRPRNENVAERYISVAGRIVALYAGTIAIDMIARGVCSWITMGEYGPGS